MSTKAKITKIIFKHPNFAGHAKILPHYALEDIDFEDLKKVLNNLNNNISGGGIFDTFKKYAAKANNLIHNIYRANKCDGKSRPLEIGEMHYGCHNYTGPGTRIDLHASILL